MTLHPALHAKVFATEKGTSYLKEPGVAVLAVPSFDVDGVRDFLYGFDESLDFPDYTNDFYSDVDPIPDSEALCKLAGQLCYMSFGEGRTMNAEAAKYFDNIKSSGHGSVLEHANISVLIYGIDRSVTHELVRHRAGFAYSQVSQRYVDGKVLRFVERKSYQDDPELHAKFVERVDRAAEEYDALAAHLSRKLAARGLEISKRDLRKMVNQDARSCLPNETEAPIIVTGNARAWRHASDMRATKHADVAIRAAFDKIVTSIKKVAPIIFDDFQREVLPDGTHGWVAKYKKV